ncbi:hypothetical protein Dsin_026402 [Dipteronia sinensis]|uniref:Uncharacterized protein n=1 Tax=Dipteronia sinensis TaxID=43782 RepID=A0AAE0DXU4_9ROSI|nr:hypothetical protein Dsin_026402 [Dipteronia sinensis]
MFWYDVLLNGDVEVVVVRRWGTQWIDACTCSKLAEFAATFQVKFQFEYTESLNYYSTVFDSLEGAVSSEAKVMRPVTEIYLGKQIFNIVACQGIDRVERHETLTQWKTGSDWYRVDENDGSLKLGWYTRHIIAISAWKWCWIRWLQLQLWARFPCRKTRVVLTPTTLFAPSSRIHINLLGFAITLSPITSSNFQLYHPFSYQKSTSFPTSHLN